MNSQSLQSKTLLLSRGTLKHLIEQHLEALGYLRNREIVTMHLGRPESGSFVALTQSAQESITLEFTTVKAKVGEEVKQYNFRT